MAWWVKSFIKQGSSLENCNMYSKS